MTEEMTVACFVAQLIISVSNSGHFYDSSKIRQKPQWCQTMLVTSLKQFLVESEQRLLFVQTGGPSKAFLWLAKCHSCHPLNSIKISKQ